MSLPYSEGKIRVFVSSVSLDKEIKLRQQRVLQCLEARQIPHAVLDMATSNADKRELRVLMHGKPLPPPQVFNGVELCGDYAAFCLAVEDEILDKFLKLKEDKKLINNKDEENKVNDENASGKEKISEKKKNIEKELSANKNEIFEKSVSSEKTVGSEKSTEKNENEIKPKDNSENEKPSKENHEKCKIQAGGETKEEKLKNKTLIEEKLKNKTLIEEKTQKEASAIKRPEVTSRKNVEEKNCEENKDAEINQKEAATAAVAANTAAVETLKTAKYSTCDVDKNPKHVQASSTAADGVMKDAEEDEEVKSEKFLKTACKHDIERMENKNEETKTNDKQFKKGNRMEKKSIPEGVINIGRRKNVTEEKSISTIDESARTSDLKNKMLQQSAPPPPPPLLPPSFLLSSGHLVPVEKTKKEPSESPPSKTSIKHFLAKEPKFPKSLSLEPKRELINTERPAATLSATNKKEAPLTPKKTVPVVDDALTTGDTRTLKVSADQLFKGRMALKSRYERPKELMKMYGLPRPAAEPPVGGSIAGRRTTRTANRALDREIGALAEPKDGSVKNK